MKIAIMGGSYNPIHLGHIQLADGFSKLIGCDKLLLIPTYIPPHKSSEQMVGENYRLDMCKIAAKKIRNCYVSDIEIRRGKVSYTADTLVELKRQYDDAEFYLICGSDMFLTIQNWKDPNIILKLVTICSAIRADEDMSVLIKQKESLEQLGGKVILSDFYISPFSSTEIRDRIKAGLAVDDMILPEIKQYIYKNALY